MAFNLTSHGLLQKAARALESGPARSSAISATSGAVGLIAGKREDARKVPIIAVVAGAGLNVMGLHTIGDGAMAGGATILGYRMGAKMARKAAGELPPVRHASVAPGRPTVRRHGRG
jgi:hypothetical protein